MSPQAPKSILPPVGVRALRSGPALTIILALVIAALAASRYALPAPTVFLLITVVYAAALGGWRAGLASALGAFLYLVWLLTDSGRAAQYQPLDFTFLTLGGVALPLAVVSGWVLHRTLQRERGHEWDQTATRAYQEGEAVGNRHFRMLVEQVRDYAIFMMDRDGRCTSWNEGVGRLLGYSETEFLGQHVSLLFTADDHARGEPERELRTAREEGRASDDRWLVRKDGSRFWATGITTLLRDGASAEGHIGYSKVLRDRTEELEAHDRLRESQERLGVALRAARMGIWRWHLPTDTHHVDGSLARLLGLGRGEIVESLEQFSEHIHPADRDQVHASFAQAVQTGSDMHIEFRVVCPDGSIQWLLSHGQLVRDEAGRPDYLTGAAIDVTERKTAEERLVEAQRMDAVGHLAGGIAHEINNMMTVVLGFSAVVIKELGTHPRAPEVRQIYRAAERAATIAGQLLAFGRRQLLRPQVLDLNRLVAGLEQVLRRVLGEDKTFVSEPAPDLGPVMADPGQMEQVLVNLTLNARDAMPQGGSFTIRTRNLVMPHRPMGAATSDELAPGRYVVLAVSDTGHGMDETTRARIFEPFFTTKPLGQGTGLGLATAFGILRQSGGTIRAHSAPGEGTTFSIYLPEVAAAPVPPEASAPTLGERGSGTVLVVEDEPLVRELTCRLLQAQGYQCLEAADGGAALDLIRQRGDLIDVVLADVVMAGMGGGALADRLAQLRPDIRVLFMTAYPSEEVIRRGLMAPDAPVLQKPFAPEELARKLGELLDSRSRHRPPAP